VSLAVESSEVRVDPQFASRTLVLAEGGRARVLVPISAERIGNHGVDVRLTTMAGSVLEKRLTVPVRANTPEVVRSSLTTLDPGGALRVSADLFEGLVPDTGSVLVSAGGAARLDVPGLVQALDRYPFGCAEQLASRALPLLYLNKVALSAGLSGDQDAAARVRDAIAGVLATQSSGGGFGLWGPGGGDPWLDAYVTDFLTRAREQGYEVNDVPFRSAIDNLRNRLAYAPDFDDGGEDVAYGLYVLARNGRAAAGDLRYYAETKLDAFATPMAKAQIAASLALYGDRSRSDTALRAAVAQLAGLSDEGGWRSDYGSALRDAAAVLALSVEAGTEAVDRAALAARVADGLSRSDFTSTQENAWLLLAAQAVNQGVSGRLSVDGEKIDGVLYRGFRATDISAAPVVIINEGEQAADAVTTVRGIPVTPPPAGGNGYSIERAFYDLEGRRIDPSRVAQGDRLVVVVTVTADERRAARLILTDPLPAGFEIDNPNLVRSGDVSSIPWLGLVDSAAHKAFLADRFAAAVDRSAGDGGQFQLAYVVRAVSPGVFSHPAATVEDMYRPMRRAWTGQSTIEVVGPLR